MEVENNMNVHDTHSSILELLSVTDAAVRALDKSTKSQGSEKSRDSHDCSPASQRSVSSKASSDLDKSKTLLRSKDLSEHLQTESGIGRSQPVSGDRRGIETGGKNAALGNESDNSTTASDVLINSTLADPSDRANRSLNTSIASTHSARNLDNFNTSGAQKVKVSRKQLREIISPRESECGPPLVSRQQEAPSRPPATSSAYSRSNSDMSASSKIQSGKHTSNESTPSDKVKTSRPASNVSVPSSKVISRPFPSAHWSGQEGKTRPSHSSSDKVLQDDRTKLPVEKHFPASSGERIVNVSLISQPSDDGTLKSGSAGGNIIKHYFSFFKVTVNSCNLQKSNNDSWMMLTNLET